MTKLTSKATAKCRQVKNRADEAGALMHEAMRRAAELRRLLATSSPEAGANIEHELAHLHGKAEGHRVIRDGNMNLGARLDYFIQTFPADMSLVDAPRFKPKRREGGSTIEAIIRLRSDIGSTRQELKQVQRAAATKAEKYEKADKYVSHLQSGFQPKMKATHEKFEVNFNDPASHTPKINIAAILAWFDPEGFIERLHAEIDAMPTPDLVLSAADKQKRIDEIRAELIGMEREEEALIEAAYEENQFIERRFDADPLAVLGLAIVRAKKIAA